MNEECKPVYIFRVVTKGRGEGTRHWALGIRGEYAGDAFADVGDEHPGGAGSSWTCECGEGELGAGC